MYVRVCEGGVYGAPLQNFSLPHIIETMKKEMAKGQKGIYVNNYYPFRSTLYSNLCDI